MSSTTARSGKHLGVVAPSFPARYPTLACSTDPELFQPDGYVSAENLAQVDQAKAVCLGCPALTECRDWAVVMAEPYGVWAATTPQEREILRKRAGLPKLRGNRYGFYDERGQRVS